MKEEHPTSNIQRPTSKYPFHVQCRMFNACHAVASEARRRVRCGYYLLPALCALFVLSCSRGPDKHTSPSLSHAAIGNAPEGYPWITHLEIADLDKDGLKDVVLADAKRNAVHWIRQSPAGTYTEEVLATNILAPAHVHVTDLDQDGDMDVLVAQMGIIFPSNEKMGKVVILENDGSMRFRKRIILEKTARVTDVADGDLDGDGDLDLSVAQFGYNDGEVRWMESLDDGSFRSHQLLALSGAIHAPIADMDGDGDIDIVAIFSQEWEELYVFENDGKGKFSKHLVHGVSNKDYGSSGITLTDLDQDGDVDILYSNGDAFDYVPPGPRPWHGIQWLENTGGLNFTFHRIGNFPGAYNARAADFDDDGDLDVLAVSLFNKWKDEDAVSLMLYENDGAQNFTARGLANTPTHLLGFDAADMNGDGRVDLISGGMHCYPPYDHINRVTLWMNE
jgi:hypothetical protein